MTPPKIQAAIAMVDDPALSRIEACLKKIPEPMIVPITIEIAEPKPNDRLSSLFSFSIKDTLLKTKTESSLFNSSLNKVNSV